jgi:predicted amidohydrolase
MMKSPLSVALCEMTSTDDPAANLKQIEAHLERGLRQGAEVFCFPENSLYFRVEKGPIEHSFSLQSPEIRKIQDWAQREKIDVFLGSVPLRGDSGKPANATVWFSPGKEPQVPYRKVHLFDVDVEGVKPVRESDDFLAGGGSAVVDLRGWKVGLSICYDLRFAELYSRYAREPVDLILIPSAFLVPTGEAHWHVLNRARAIESQAFVVSAAQGGTHHGSRGGQRHTYGHSLVVSPWGEILAEARANSETLVVGLDPGLIDRARTQIPMKSHRKFP